MNLTIALPPVVIDQLAALILASLKPHLNAEATKQSSTAKTSLPLLTVKEVAKRLKCVEKTVLKHIKDGKLNAANFGTWDRPSYKISEADFLAFYQGHGGKR